ncbi:MAG: PilZ domain-containing protein [Desulfovibrio sp.]|uniref:PilZ domain-containing protein n=1 Tax=Desulfovibrio sp. 7SRBS1 TaxID=3378064 RepID=UPI003B3F9867
MQRTDPRDRRSTPRLPVGSNMCVLRQNQAECLLCRMDDASIGGMKFSVLNPDRVSELHVGDTMHLDIYPDSFQEFVTTRQGTVVWIKKDTFGLKLK